MAKNNRNFDYVQRKEKNIDNLEDNTEKSIPFITFSDITARVIVFVVAIVCYINSYDGDFVFDDSEAVENNKDLLPSTPLGNLLENDFWGRKMSNLSHKSYRPLTVLTFRWNYWFADGLHPKGFHIVNILLHGVVSSMLCPVFSLILSAGSKHGFQKSSFLSSLLFAVHPVHTESVAAVVGRADLLCALFFILSFLCYIKGTTKDVPVRPESFSYAWISLSLLFCAMATFSKEQGITVIGVCSAYDLIVVCGIDIVSYVSLGKLKSAPNEANATNGIRSFKARTRYSQWQISLIKRHFLLFVAATFLLAVRWQVMGSAPPTFQVHDNPHSFVEGRFFRALNYNYLYAINAWLLVCPQWLCFDWSMGCVPTIESLADIRLLGLVALWAVVSLLVWTCLYAENTRLKRSLSLAMALTIVPFLPATNILFRVGFVVAERVLYLPSAGFCLVVILGLQQLSQKKSFSKVVTFGFLLLLLVFFSRSVQRSNEWRRGIWLFKSGEKVCPLNAKVHYNIAKLSGDSGNTTYAIERYELAIKLNPVYDQAMNNLANIYKDQNKVEEAENLLDRAVQISPDFAAAWMNRGIVKGALKKYSEAEYSYKQGIRYRRNYPDCYYNLGNLYLDMNRSQDALDAWRNATMLKPTHWNSWNNAIILMDNLKIYEQAENLALTALKIMPDNPTIMFSLANVYGKQDKYAESEKMFLAAIKRDPSNPNIHLNLGVLYHRWGKYKEAETSYQRSLLISPNNGIALENMNLLKAKMKSSS